MAGTTIDQRGAEIKMEKGDESDQRGELSSSIAEERSPDDSYRVEPDEFCGPVHLVFFADCRAAYMIVLLH